MAGLVLKLRAHEEILVNGVVIQNGDRSARLIIKTPNVHVLRLREALQPQEIDTPVKRVCYVAQLAVTGEADADEAGIQLARGIAELRDALAGIEGSEQLDRAAELLERGDFYGVLRALRRLLPLEATLLGGAGRPPDRPPS